MHIKEEQTGMGVRPEPIRFPVGSAPKLMMPEGYAPGCYVQITRETWEHTYQLFECAGRWGLLVLEAAFTRAG